jgi:hypothetical protein
MNELEVGDGGNSVTAAPSRAELSFSGSSRVASDGSAAMWSNNSVVTLTV